MPSLFPDGDSEQHQAPSCMLDDDSERSQTTSRNGHHGVAQSQTASAQDDYDAKVELLRSAFRHLSAELWELGDGQRYGWVFEELDELDQELDQISKEELVRRLRSIYKRLAYAKGRRGDHKQDSNCSGGAHMPIYIEVPKRVVVARGEHRAKIVSVSQPEPSKFAKDKQAVRVTFEIVDGQYKGQKLVKYYTATVSPKAALGQLWRRLFGEPKADPRVNLEQLVGQDVSIVVSHKSGEDGEYAVVQDVFAGAEGPTGTGAADPSEQGEAMDCPCEVSP